MAVNHRRSSQLSLNVELPPELKRQADAGETITLVGTVKGTLDLPVGIDLNSGDELIVTLADGNGTVLSTAYLAIKAPAFREIEDKDLGLIGLERVHPFKIAEIQRPGDQPA